MSVEEEDGLSWNLTPLLSRMDEVKSPLELRLDGGEEWSPRRRDITLQPIHSTHHDLHPPPYLRPIPRGSPPKLRCSAPLLHHLLPLLTILTLAGRVSGTHSLSQISMGLSGRTQRCENEGGLWSLPDFLRDPCYTCLCKNGEVECAREVCPSLQGCFLVVEGLKEGCCDVCKGCGVGGSEWKSGRVEVEGCFSSTCGAGVLTKSPLQCYTPCPNPLPPPPGSCCPTCPTCTLYGREYGEGTELRLLHDPCVTCKCEGGRMGCERESCPVLACPPSATYLDPHTCCPKCNGTRTRYIPRTVCVLGEKVYPSGTRFRLDSCTNCTCTGSTTLCDRVSCPPLDCSPEEQVLAPGSCCPHCPLLPPKEGCEWRGTRVKEGSGWEEERCRRCVCHGGQVRCVDEKCGESPCPPGSKRVHSPGFCCPKCVPEEGVCTVFGDPHYSTFDGRLFNFQGTCKYLLSSNCRSPNKTRSFSVRVRNDGRGTKGFSWTRTVSLRTREVRVTLGQRGRVKVEGKSVSLPFSSPPLHIHHPEGEGEEEGGGLVEVETGVGVRLVWDGLSFLEVMVHPSLHSQLCGLCGNWNGNKWDDFVSRRGSPVVHPNAFGLSWQVGGRKGCGELGRPLGKGRGGSCRKSVELGKKGERLCSGLTSAVFQPCAQLLPTNKFFKSCLLDMCECPVGRNCHCEVFTAYARACEREGVRIPKWRTATNCTRSTSPPHP